MDCQTRGDKGATVCCTSLTHFGMSYGGRAQDQSLEEKNKRIKEALKALVTPKSDCDGIDLIKL